MYEYESITFLNMAAVAPCVVLACMIGRLSCGKQGAIEWLFMSAAAFLPVFVGAGALMYRFGLSAAELCVTAGVLTALIWLWIRSRKEHEWKIEPVKSLMLAAVVVAAAVLLRVLLMWHTELPFGDDARFHCLFAASVSRVGKLVGTMAPFDPLPLKYPWGLTVMLAAAHDLGGIPPHAAFKFLLIFYSAVSVAGIYVLARHALGSEASALWGAALYGLAANYGSIDYIRWGGLANAAVMVSLMAVLIMALRGTENGKFSMAAGAPLIAAAFFIHGVAGLLNFAIVLIIGLVLIFRGGGSRAAGIKIGISSLAALIALMLFAPDIFRDLGTIGRSAGQYPERYMSVFDFPLIFNIIFTAAAALGFAAVVKKGKGAGPMMLFTWTAALLFGFIASRYGFGLLNYVRHGNATPAFLPSRLITDLVYPLAVFAGAGFVFVFNRIKSFEDRRIRTALSAVVVALVLQVPFQYAADKRGQTAASPETLRAMDWIAKNTPRNALVINDARAEASLWLPYRADRVTTLAPRPVLYHLNAGEAADAIRKVQGKESINRLLFETGDMERLRKGFEGAPHPWVYVYTGQPLDVPGAQLEFKTDTVYIYKLDSKND